jgi:hypothetical protein
MVEGEGTGALSPTESSRRPTRERTIQPGPRFTLMLWWVLIDAAIAAVAVWWGFANLERNQPMLAYALFAASATLLLLDSWRLAFLERVRKLVAKGRIEQAQIVSVKKSRFSLRPRADAPSPTGGWPIVSARKVSYTFARKGSRRVKGAFVVAAKEAEMFSPGEDIEVFVDRDDATRLIPTLVARWYFRVSSRMIGTGADDLEWDFTNPPPAVREKGQGSPKS